MYVELAKQARVVAGYSGALTAGSYVAAHLRGDAMFLHRVVRQKCLSLTDLEYACESGLWQAVCKERLLRTEANGLMYLTSLCCLSAYEISKHILGACPHLRQTTGLVTSESSVPLVLEALTRNGVRHTMADEEYLAAATAKGHIQEFEAGDGGVYVISAPSEFPGSFLADWLSGRVCFVGLLRSNDPGSLWDFHDTCLVGGCGAYVTADESTLKRELDALLSPYGRLTDLQSERDIVTLFQRTDVPGKNRQ